MNIKRLEIKGFKSFSDKTVFEFESGITCIVGPNGCGKSNVLEALRWVMGEQRTRMLRTHKMEDVIFNGSDARKPVGMAEVRLVLSTDGKISSDLFGQYDEMMIVRRLYRDGESQYEINNVSCRLSDITDFFLDTGIGKSSYAIVEQGKVEQIVASKPEDRRSLIEEAAGIGKYKARKASAIRKLEETQQNLLRIKDIIGEVKRQSSGLKKQTARARRYREISEKLRKLDLEFNSYEYQKLKIQFDARYTELESLKLQLIQSESRHAVSQAQLESCRLALVNLEKRYRECMEVFHKIEIELATIRNGRERNKDNIMRLKERLESSRRESQDLEVRKIELEKTLGQIETESFTLGNAIETYKSQLGSAAKDRETSEKSLSSVGKSLEDIKEKMFEILQKTAIQKNNLESFRKRLSETTSAVDRSDADYEKTSQALLRLETEAQSQVMQEQEIRENLQEAITGKKALEADRLVLEKLIHQLRHDAAELEKLLSAYGARLDYLAEDRRSFSGYDDGVRFVMQSIRKEFEHDIMGPLAEIIEAPEAYQRAVASVLGQRLSSIIVSSTHYASEIVEMLVAQKGSRTTFIPVTPRFSIPKAPSPKGDNRAKPLLDVVSFPPDFDELGRFLLGSFSVVADIREAMDLWKKSSIPIDLVTMNGEVLTWDGTMSGGAPCEKQEEVLEKRLEFDRLEQDIEITSEKFSGIHNELERREALMNNLQNRTASFDKTIGELRVELTSIEKDRERTASQISGSKQRLQVIKLERARHLRDVEDISRHLAQGEKELILLETERSAVDDEKKQLSQNVMTLQAVLSEKSQILETIRVEIAKVEERHHSKSREADSTGKQLEEVSTQLSNLYRQHVADERDLEKAEQEISSGATLEIDLVRRHQEQTRLLEGFRIEIEEASSKLTNLENGTVQEESALKILKDRIYSLEMEKVRLDEAIKNLLDKIQERHGVDLTETIAPECVPEMTEIVSLRKDLENLGEVNLAAISESKQVEERLSFLMDQESDLNKAVQSLYETINKINKRTIDRFCKAFENVNKNFQEIFPVLFHGGEGSLKMTDDENPLDTGIEILARPPGKKIKNMDLLSGGEKALTAVALIFAIFLTHPSPFCLLDEVDAPLDDANLLRFNDMIRRLSDRTQFLVITHNKRSMEIADCLYGITMEDLGVSKVVSVKLLN
jgi:chromosome segregation protein